MYEINIETFQGPLDVLLGLISKQKVRIEEVSIAEITDQYMDYLKEMEKLDIEIASEFIVMASVLLYIKSKSMLPKQTENEDEGDPEEELRRRLIEYKIIKEAAFLLSQREGEFAGIYSKLPEEIIIDESQMELKDMSSDKLREAFEKILLQKPYLAPEETVMKMKRDPMTITQAMDYIQFVLVDRPSILFEEVFEKFNTKQEIVTLFIGMLELIKENIITVNQECTYAPITVLRGSLWMKGNRSE